MSALRLTAVLLIVLAFAPALPGGEPVESCGRIDVEWAEIRTLDSAPPQYALAVTGTKPSLNMDVELVPLVYLRQPESWGIEVIGCLPGIGLPALGPYAVSLAPSGSLGTQGIEVIGATRAQPLDVPPGWTVSPRGRPPCTSPGAVRSRRRGPPSSCGGTSRKAVTRQTCSCRR